MRGVHPVVGPGYGRQVTLVMPDAEPVAPRTFGPEMGSGQSGLLQGLKRLTVCGRVQLHHPMLMGQVWRFLLRPHPSPTPTAAEGPSGAQFFREAAPCPLAGRNTHSATALGPAP